MEKVKVGIVGTGYTIGIALPHVMAYKDNPNVEMVALYDEVKGKAKKWAKDNKIEDVIICESYDELLESVDAISICTPNNTHAELSLKALENGVHVLCEKPISTDSVEAKKMVEAAEKYPELVNMTGFCYRGIPAIKYMKSIIDEGKIGKIYACNHQLGGGRIAGKENVMLEWRMRKETSGTGALADFGSHMLDLTDYLLSDTEGKISEVTSLINTCIKERNVIGGKGKAPVTNDDTAAFAVKLKEGAVSTFLSSRVGLSAHNWEIIGEGGILIYFGDDNKIKMLLKDKDESFAFDKSPEIIDVPEEFKVKSRFHEQNDEFISNVMSGQKSKRDFKRGLYIQELLDTLAESTETGNAIKL
ncbi:Gfo/Idh/MocA family protein [Alkalibacter saccharofermentans]|uniref:Predicted dehydrogenase n=1 Tax=Alkalibacter saccharofermentans DSM 14828 TaxID=1120975 RepID=A0A1M4U4D7_9FIRM|nr:Gfo/Idh/MocA family oxidoreductase [Alkalibacter saccharofermentans]SHE51599.1 Predicted dehydrogenase [Alkalibacter saccharofermentans DSM 14828]